MDVQIIFGWPLIVLTILVAGFGLVKGGSIWLYAAAFLSIPFALYLAATPRLFYAGLILPLAFAYSGNLLKRGRPVFALLAVLPYLAVVLWFAYGALTQPPAG